MLFAPTNAAADDDADAPTPVRATAPADDEATKDNS